MSMRNMSTVAVVVLSIESISNVQQKTEKAVFCGNTGLRPLLIITDRAEEKTELTN